MRILIDGYNLLHASTVTPSRTAAGTLDATRNALLDFLIVKLPPRLAQLTTVVFDRGTERGLPARTSYGPLDIRFAINHPEADDLIEELVRAHSAPKNLTVVSSDHRIQRAAKRRKSRAVDSERWLLELSHSSKRHSERADEPVDVRSDWLSEFADVDLDQIKREIAAEDLTDEPTSQPRTDPNRSKRPGRKPKPEDAGDNSSFVENPFPPGYGEDLLDE